MATRDLAFLHCPSVINSYVHEFRYSLQLIRSNEAVGASVVGDRVGSFDGNLVAFVVGTVDGTGLGSSL